MFAAGLTFPASPTKIRNKKLNKEIYFIFLLKSLIHNNIQKPQNGQIWPLQKACHNEKREKPGKFEQICKVLIYSELATIAKTVPKMAENGRG